MWYERATDQDFPPVPKKRIDVCCNAVFRLILVIHVLVVSIHFRFHTIVCLYMVDEIRNSQNKHVLLQNLFPCS